MEIKEKKYIPTYNARSYCEKSAECEKKDCWDYISDDMVKEAAVLGHKIKYDQSWKRYNPSSCRYYQTISAEKNK